MNAICPKTVFSHPFYRKIEARHSFEASKCTGNGGAMIAPPTAALRFPLFFPPTRRISDFLASSRGSNLGRFFDVPPYARSESQMGIDASTAGI
ncbi:hypothetical protein AVEN_184858-1 [Araneus ventricosus]|uniref:Uncharacterized protein n=1 Tax=Araneus ventricosus TaxID=182803 RepID=A0A4Y2MG77_ARAVE|nr:hypothetical protein AVEN_184858-1 [Araneus ventricosus]